MEGMLSPADVAVLSGNAANYFLLPDDRPQKY